MNPDDRPHWIPKLRTNRQVEAAWSRLYNRYSGETLQTKVTDYWFKFDLTDLQSRYLDRMKKEASMHEYYG